MQVPKCRSAGCLPLMWDVNLFWQEFHVQEQFVGSVSFTWSKMGPSAHCTVRIWVALPTLQSHFRRSL